MAIPMVGKSVPLTSIEVAKKEIEMIVCRELNVNILDVLSATRIKEVVECRNLIVYFLRKYNLGTTSQIGLWLNKDHSSIIYASKRVFEQADVYANYRLLLERLSIMIDLKIK